MSEPRAKSYTLDCRHVLWLKYAPRKDDELWCVKCQRYEPLFLAKGKAEWYSPSGEYRASNVRGVFIGACLFDKCIYAYGTPKGFDDLDRAMHSHYMREHTKWKVNIKIADRPSPGSSPPF